MLGSCCPTIRVPGTAQWSRMCSCILNRSCSIGMYAAWGSGRNSAGGMEKEVKRSGKAWVPSVIML